MMAASLHLPPSCPLSPSLSPPSPLFPKGENGLWEQSHPLPQGTGLGQEQVTDTKTLLWSCPAARLVLDSPRVQALLPSPHPPEPNANLIYDVCTKETTLERPFKSSCHFCTPCQSSLLISTAFFFNIIIKAKSLFPVREQLLNRTRPGPPDEL